MKRVMVFAPAPKLTVEIERRGGDDDVHLHAGGQGFWIARMLAALGAPVVLCGCFGGETGPVLRRLIEQAGIEVRAVEVQAGNATSVRDPRAGAGPAIAETTMPVLSRHDVDALYGLTLVHGLEASVCVLGGAPGRVIPPDTYGRLAHDLRTNGKTVVADVSGDQLAAVVDGGVDVLKVSHVELIDGGWSQGDDLVAALHDLASRGLETVVVSRAEQPALVRLRTQLLQVSSPRLMTLEARGAGDSMTAGIAAGIARDYAIGDAIRLGAAAGAINVTRRGLASGDRDAIEKLAEHVELQPAEPVAPRSMPSATTTPSELAARARPR